MTGTLRGVSNKHCLLSFFHCFFLLYLKDVEIATIFK